MVRIAVAGAAGRMGRRILALAAADPELEVTGAFEAPDHPAVGKSLKELTGTQLEGLVLSDPARAMEGAEVLVDFTAPKATAAHVALAARMGLSAVVGTTGLGEEERKAVAEAARQVGVVIAPNMSVGMNLMFKLAGLVAKILGEDYAVELVEAHHDQKKDAPSGSAIRLLEAVAEARGWELDKVARYGRVGMVGPRPAKEIGVSVIRGGDIVGEHTLMFITGGERIELTHRAHSRDTFARGALRAAIWVAKQKPGLYDMADVLGLGELG